MFLSSGSSMYNSTYKLFLQLKFLENGNSNNLHKIAWLYTINFIVHRNSWVNTKHVYRVRSHLCEKRNENWISLFRCSRWWLTEVGSMVWFVDGCLNRKKLVRRDSNYVWELPVLSLLIQLSVVKIGAKEKPNSKKLVLASFRFWKSMIGFSAKAMQFLNGPRKKQILFHLILMRHFPCACLSVSSTDF